MPDGGGGGGGGGGSFGYGKPTLEVTVGGQHFGPAAPDTGSGVDLQTSRDAAGQVTSASLTITASSAVTGAGCTLGFQRFGTSIAPFRGGGAVYHIAGVIDNTPDGVVSPASSEVVGVPQLVLQCSGSDCNGGVLLLSTLAADHVEGSFSGDLLDTGGQGATSAICSFYLPTRSFSP